MRASRTFAVVLVLLASGKAAHARASASHLSVRQAHPWGFGASFSWLSAGVPSFASIGVAGERAFGRWFAVEAGAETGLAATSPDAIGPRKEPHLVARLSIRPTVPLGRTGARHAVPFGRAAVAHRGRLRWPGASPYRGRVPSANLERRVVAGRRGRELRAVRAPARHRRRRLPVRLRRPRRLWHAQHRLPGSPSVPISSADLMVKDIRIWPNRQPRPPPTHPRSTSSVRWSSWNARSTSWSGSAAAPRSCAPRSQLLESRARELQQKIFADLTPWQKVQLSRHPARPYTLDYIERLIDGFIELHGDRRFADDPAIVGGFGTFDGTPVLVLGHQKGRSTKEKVRRNFGQPKPEGYRKALRLMELAARIRRPIICFIDTQGAYPGIDAEERGQAEAIAKNLEVMAGLPGADRVRRDRRGRLGRRAGARRRQPHPDAGVRDLLGDLARGLRVDPVARRRQEARGGGGDEDDRDRPAAPGRRRRDRARGAGRRAPRSRRVGADPGRGAAAPPEGAVLPASPRSCAPIATRSSATWARSSSRATRRRDAQRARVRARSLPKRCA